MSGLESNEPGYVPEITAGKDFVFDEAGTELNHHSGINTVSSIPDRILVLDDAPTVNTNLVMTMQMEFQANNSCGYLLATRARKYLENTLHEHSLIFCDINLQDGNGIDFGLELRKKGYQGVLVIVSGEIHGDDLVRISAIGGNTFFLKKPYDLDVLEKYYEMSVSWAKSKSMQKGK